MANIVDDQDPYAAEEQALANDLSGNGVTVTSIVTTAEVPTQDPYEIQDVENGNQQVSAADINSSPQAPQGVITGTQTFDDGSTITTNSDGSVTSTAATDFADSSGTSTSSAAAAVQSATTNATQQQTIAAQTGQEASSTDWRLRISLAKGSNYLYNAPITKQKGSGTSAQNGPGILQPLKVTNGVIFPYTPKIDLSYKANYSPYDLTHSNYRGYFYTNSNVGDITITGHFTAQNSRQADYLLAVIHFFRSATKMFYGQDAQRGTPPPLVFLNGLGQYQFNNHPCLITEFTYSLPEDVDYIRAGVANNLGLNAQTISNVLNSAVASGAITGVARLAAAFTTPGALPETPFGSLATPNLASGAPTYVPTKMDITVRLLPVNTRQQVSKQFSLGGFANGDLLRKGFW